MRTLADITRKEIEEAFAKAVSESDLSNEGALVLVTEEYYDKTLQLARESFTNDETICKSLGLEWNPDLEGLWRSIIEKNVSILLLNHETGDAIGFRTLAFEYGNSIKNQDIVHRETKILASIIDEINEKCDVYNRFKVDEVAHFFAICINKKYRNHGLGYKLMKFAIEFLTNLNIKPLCIRAEGTSNISQHIFEKLSFEKLMEIKYSQYRYEGEAVLKNTGEHKSVKGYALLIN